MPRCSASGRRLTGEIPGRDGLSRGQHTELIAIGICHHHPADSVLANVDSTRTEAHETVDLLLISVDRWSEVEMQPILPDLRSQWRSLPLWSASLGGLNSSRDLSKVEPKSFCFGGEA